MLAGDFEFMVLCLPKRCAQDRGYMVCGVVHAGIDGLSLAVGRDFIIAAGQSCLLECLLVGTAWLLAPFLCV